MKSIIRKALILIIVVFAIGGVIWAVVTRLPAKQEASDIPTYVVKSQPFTVSITSIGAIEAISSKAITAPFNGKIVKLIPEGTFVQEGEPVIWFDTTNLDQEKQNLETDVKLAESRVVQNEEELRLLETKQKLASQAQEEKIKYQEVVYNDSLLNYDTEKKLVERSLAPRSRLDEAKLSLLQSELSLKQEKINLNKMLETNKSQLVAKRADIEKAKIELEHSRNRLDKTQRELDQAVLKAPGSGYMIYMQIWKGGTSGKPAEGDQVYPRFTLAQIPDSSIMLVVLPINELDIDRVDVGQKVRVTVDAIPDATYEAEIISKSVVPISDSAMRAMFSTTKQTKAKEFEVRAKILENDERFRPGMTAMAEIIIEQKESIPAVPIIAIFNDGDEKLVFKKTDMGYQRIEVALGSMNENFTEVTTGISEGDVVFLRDPSQKVERVRTKGKKPESNNVPLAIPNAQ